jgi:SpoVK/Ycf46/Vps4 family AAA+-type ATPase
MSNPQIDSLKSALQFSPENQALRKILIQAYLDLFQYEEALDELKKGLQLSPGDDGLKMGMAHCYFHLKNYSTAQVILEELLEKGVEVAENTLLLSRVFLETNELKHAKEQYDKAMEIDPDVDDEDFEEKLNEALKNSGLASMVSYDEMDALLDGIDIEKPTIDFSAIGGLANIKEEIALKVIHPLKHPEIYKAYGKKIGGGILMYGPPGCGKTLIARATAGEIKANFISVGINDVLDMWVGNSEKNLHDIFEQARLNTPCVLFFDEVDAMAASRNDMRKTNSRFLINQFLDELDGVKHSNEGILVLGATNSPWFLDTAFRRPGRFDRIIFISPPDLQAREEILTLILQEKPTESIDVKAIAKLTDGYSGADLQALLDLAIESKLSESLKLGKVLPISTSDLKNAAPRHRATTKEWFTTAKNYALYSNEGGLYDDILTYLNIKK